MRSRIVLIGAVLVSLYSAAAQAQEAVIAGQITTSDDGLSLPGATVSIPALNISTVTDEQGRYSLTVPAASVKGQSVEMRISFAGLVPKTIPITLSPGMTTKDVALGLGYFEEVTVGSRTAGVAAEKSVSVDVLTAEDIASSGAVETNQIIQALAPSFNFPRPTITDGTDSVRPATLRGLGPDQVLVLINGKRRHTGALVHVNGSIGRGSTGVDLNAIPASAIQRIEVCATARRPNMDRTRSRASSTSSSSPASRRSAWGSRPA